MLLEAFVPDEAIAVFRRHGVTMAGGCTAFHMAFLNAQRKQPDEPLIPTLRLLSGGGAPKPPEVHFEIKDEMHMPDRARLRHDRVPDRSRMARPTDTDDQSSPIHEGRRSPGSTISVVQLDGDAAGAGEEGEIRAQGGPMLFKGYIDASLDAAAFDDEGFFRTGDLGVLDGDGLHRRSPAG